MDSFRRWKVRARCREVLAQLDIVDRPSRPLTQADVRDRVQRRRGRPLLLTPMVSGAGWPSGMWVETEDTDLVLFDAATSALHTVDIIAHEIGHMVLGHEGTVTRPAPGPAVMLRTGFADRDEHEAEVFATLVCARIADYRIPVPDEPEGLMGRLRSVLADPPAGG
jgi:hypothetical protein